jgi:NO-binding membrane sensor protein with MHYT domain
MSSYIFEKETSSKLTALSISSMHMKMMIALRLINAPITPIENNRRLRNK